jgi:hypothetical protein
LADAHKNFATSLVATAPSPASSGASLVVTAADGAKFPAVPFNATIWPASSQPTTANAEIVRVTNISTDTLTITRAQESSSARTVVIGDQIAATITAKTLTDVEHNEYANTYLTVADETIPASTQVIYEGYLELAASFVWELAVDALLIIGDFATPLPLSDQYANVYTTVADESIPRGSQVLYDDYLELSAPFAFELSSDAILVIGDFGSPTIRLDGWVDDTAETWAYVSGSGGGVATFSVPGDVRSKSTVGTRIRLSQGTVSYFVVSAAPTLASNVTTVTIFAGTDYTLANAPISGNYHSYEANPQGYPGTFNFTSGATGWVSFTTNSAKFSVVGRTCHVYYRLIGTSNATTTTASLPIASVLSSFFLPQAAGYFDGSTTGLGNAYCSAASTVTFQFNSTIPPLDAGWASSGNKNITVDMIYEI